jgi:hypothetical protein
MSPLAFPDSIRLPPAIDMKMLGRKHFPRVTEIEGRAKDSAMKARMAGDPHPTVQALEAELVKAFQIEYPSSHFDMLRIFALNGWAIGVLEEQSGLARRRKSERHYASALNLRRGALIGETPAALQTVGDAYELGIFNAYFLCRAPDISVADLGVWWDSEVEATRRRLGLPHDTP